ncbi:kinesin-like protein KIF3B [Glandiceps talaboti]
MDIREKSEEVVVVSRQPMNQEEIAAGHEGVIEMDINSRKPLSIIQRGLYDERFRVVVDSVLEDFNVTISSYGQIGMGKTFTMEGVWSDPDLRDLIPDSFDHKCTHISQSENPQYLVRASYLEIYQDKISDLLSKVQKEMLELKKRPDTGVYVMDLISFDTKSVTEIEHVVNVGNQNRTVGATNMNEHSSNSHAVFLTLECREGERSKEATKINLPLAVLDNVTSATLVNGKSTHIPYRDSKLTRLKDSLGGNVTKEMVANIGPARYNYDEFLTTLSATNMNEHSSNSHAVFLTLECREGERSKEATKINLPLAVLDNVTSATLVNGKSTHIPYRRDSKLTRLKDSLGGNVTKEMVANIGPARYNYDEFLTTLRYNGKNMKNKPKINEDPKDALLREFQDEIVRPKSQLDKKGGGGQVTLKKRQRRMTAGMNYD